MRAPALSAKVTEPLNRGMSYLSAGRLDESAKSFEEIALELDAEFNSYGNKFGELKSHFRDSIKTYRDLSVELRLLSFLSQVNSFEYQITPILNLAKERGYVFETRGHVRMERIGLTKFYDGTADLVKNVNMKILKSLIERYESSERVRMEKAGERGLPFNVEKPVSGKEQIKAIKREIEWLKRQEIIKGRFTIEQFEAEVADLDWLFGPDRTTFNDEGTKREYKEALEARTKRKELERKYGHLL